MKILLIDDDPLSLSGLKLSLEEQGGHKCSAYENPSEALDAYKHEQFDLVITDVRMPEITGMEVLKKIRSINSEAVVIMITGQRYVEAALESITFGAHAIMSKPLHSDKLLDMIRRVENQIRK